MYESTVRTLYVSNTLDVRTRAHQANEKKKKMKKKMKKENVDVLRQPYDTGPGGSNLPPKGSPGGGGGGGGGGGSLPPLHGHGGGGGRVASGRTGRVQSGRSHAGSESSGQQYGGGGGGGGGGGWGGGGANVEHGRLGAHLTPEARPAYSYTPTTTCARFKSRLQHRSPPVLAYKKPPVIKKPPVKNTKNKIK